MVLGGVCLVLLTSHPGQELSLNPILLIEQSSVRAAGGSHHLLTLRGLFGRRDLPNEHLIRELFSTPGSVLFHGEFIIHQRDCSALMQVERKSDSSCDRPVASPGSKLSGG